VLGVLPRRDLLTGQRHGELVTGVHRGEEAQVLQAVVGQHGPRIGLDEQAGREGDDQVPVGHPAVEERVGPRGLLVHMGVEGVAGEVGEVLDVGQRHPARARHHAVTDAQFGERLTERVTARRVPPGTGHPAAGDRRQHARAGLDRGALHVMHHAAHATHLLPAAGPPGPAVHEHGQR